MEIGKVQQNYQVIRQGNLKHPLMQNQQPSFKGVSADKILESLIPQAKSINTMKSWEWLKGTDFSQYVDKEIEVKIFI